MTRSTLAAALVLALTGAACAPGEGEPREGGQEAAGEQAAGLSAAVETHIGRLAARAPTVIVGRVVSIEPGRVAGPPGDRLQFEDVGLAVEESLKGDEVTPHVVVEQVSSQVRTVLDFEPFRGDGRYLLFLRPSQTEAGRQVVLPGGRFELTDGRATSLPPDPVGAGESWPEAELLDRAREETARQPGL